MWRRINRIEDKKRWIWKAGLEVDVYVYCGVAGGDTVDVCGSEVWMDVRNETT